MQDRYVYIVANSLHFVKGIFLSGQDKTESRLLKDIALSLHDEFDSIEIRYPGAKGAFKNSENSLFVIPESELEQRVRAFESENFVPKSIVAVSKNKRASTGKASALLKKLEFSSLLLTLEDLKNSVLLRRRIKQHLDKNK